MLMASSTGTPGYTAVGRAVMATGMGDPTAREKRLACAGSAFPSSEEYVRRLNSRDSPGVAVIWRVSSATSASGELP